MLTIVSYNTKRESLKMYSQIKLTFVTTIFVKYNGQWIAENLEKFMGCFFSNYKFAFLEIYSKEYYDRNVHILENIF